MAPAKKAEAKKVEAKKVEPEEMEPEEAEEAETEEDKERKMELERKMEEELSVVVPALGDDEPHHHGTDLHEAAAPVKKVHKERMFAAPNHHIHGASKGSA